MAKVALDAADIRILSAVQKHGQLSKSKLAEIVNLSPTACWSRYTHLKNAGFIEGYHARIATRKIANISKIIVTVSLSNHKKVDFDKFENYVRDLDEVIECIATGGGTDYVLTIITPDLDAFQELMQQFLSADLSIEKYMTYIVTREVKSILPNLNKLTK